MININNFIYSNLYEYDINSCFYNILKSINYPISHINFEDKKQRNIQIGLLQKENPKISILLESEVKKILDIYLDKNNLSIKNIIWKQKDGFILNKPLNNLNITLPIEFRGLISKLIFSMTKKQTLLLYNNNEIDIKGISNKKPLDISFYNLFHSLNFNNKKSLSISLEQLRKEFFNNNINIKWHCFEKNNKIIIYTKHGILTIDKSFLLNINSNDIDKTFIWNNFIWMFCQTILIYCCDKNI